jgi:release factor glutamine methyltransferase
LLDAELLMAHVLGVDRAWVLAHPEAPVSDAQRELFGGLARRRAVGEPIAYLLGRKLWHGLDLEVGPGVLVPRPETEILLDGAVAVAREMGASVICDVGTGSGALAVGLAVQLPRVHVIATDVSAEALEVARRNVEQRGLRNRVTLLRGDLLDPVNSLPDLVVANLPYLSEDLMAALPVDVTWEPAVALRGGRDGFDAYRRLSEDLTRRGWNPPLLIEIDPAQRELIPVTFRRYRVEVLPDYAGHDRVAILRPER